MFIHEVCFFSGDGNVFIIIPKRCVKPWFAVGIHVESSRVYYVSGSLSLLACLRLVVLRIFIEDGLFYESGFGISRSFVDNRTSVIVITFDRGEPVFHEESICHVLGRTVIAAVPYRASGIRDSLIPVVFVFCPLEYNLLITLLGEEKILH